jgi:Cys-tRNA(Pro)/Cys-tRNA(Cys) deacylase
MDRVTSRGTPATDLLRRLAVPHEVREYAVRTAADGRHNYGIEAAAALGVDPAVVFKTLIVSADDRLAVGIVPVTGELDLKAMAAALGARRAVMAEPAAAERSSGYVVGGISPFGQKRRLPTVVDASATAHPHILVSAGRRGLQVEVAPQDLVRVLEAKVAPIVRSG